jgi:MFS family permease
MVSSGPVPRESSAWAPLRVSAFRALWIAQLFSLIGTWMQTVGAQWLLVDEPDAATLVGLVQTAAMLPTLALALPAGAMADILDRRRLLIGVQLFQVAVGAVLVLLTVFDLLSPALLLTMTMLLGVGMTLTIPAYQTLVGELVGRPQMRSASALNGIAMNLARAIGPAIAGVLIGAVGVAAVFALNALTYVAMAIVLIRLRPPPTEEVLLPERFRHALATGARFVRHSLVVRRMLIRTTLFVVPGAAIWALLPLVASSALGLDATGYGILLGALGIGAVLGAVVLPRVVAIFSPNGLILLASLVFGAGTAVAAWAPGLVPVLIFLVPAGAAWLWMLATMNGSLQVFLPGWVRARGLSIYQMVFAGGQALASLAWGLLASWIGVPAALLIAAAMLAIGGASVGLLPLWDVSGLDRDPAVYWPEPYLQMEPAPEDGPVLVMVSYTVPAANLAQFLDAMIRVRRMKMRTGATSFAVYQDGGDPNRFVEVAEYPSWAEHLRQHGGRLTASDQAIEETALACADGSPVVQHLLPPSSTARP